MIQKLAFKPKRFSGNVGIYRKYSIHLLNGKYLGADSSSKFQFIEGLPTLYEKVPVLKNERLFVEVIMNYHYFGGADMAWESLAQLVKRVDLNLLFKEFKEMNLVYPYQNVIGYILETFGVKQEELTLWRNELREDVQFHLFMGDGERRVWNDRWKIYIPKRFC